MPNKVRLTSPPRQEKDLNQRVWLDWFNLMYERVGEGPFLLRGYSVSNLPSASSWGNTSSDNPFSSLIFVYDETGGATLAFSDGTDWRRLQDRAIVS